MAELGGRRLSREEMVAIIKSGRSVSYHGKKGSRIISRLERLPSLAELVEDGFVNADEAQATVDAQLAALEKQKQQLSGKGRKQAAKSEAGKGGE